MKYLLDTTWAVEYFRGNEHLARRVQDLAEDGLAVSMISVAELYEGVFRSDDPPNNEQVLRDFLRAVTVLDVSEATARAYGELRASLA